MKGWNHGDPECVLDAEKIMEYPTEEELAASDARVEQMEKEFDAAPTRESKLQVLKGYMSEAQAEDAIGFMLGEHAGDRVDESGGNFGARR